jgi:hypothetical protein
MAENQTALGELSAKRRNELASSISRFNFLKKLDSFKRISVSWSSSFSDQDFQAIREAFPALESLDLFSFDRVDDGGLAYLQDMPLTSLNLQACRHITEARRNALREAQPNLNS